MGTFRTIKHLSMMVVGLGLSPPGTGNPEGVDPES